ncbi:armadillo-type protein [Polychytrium aggregatum]|uniref:armadillo-type protein n=1 Tax=Polychytrium aggregatum TaxID=110093 RepID=UPI0022FE046D|nr:armadillo-type protein [Polychytrium aggregatum]KAI9203895.1 armadillo-type protein [Polychytrium aggregatum]
MSVDIQQLQNLLFDYFENSLCSATRKKEIENELIVIKALPDAIAICQGLLPQANKDYIQWYCLSVYEFHVERWQQLPSSTRLELKQYLWNTLKTENRFFAAYVTNKIIKLVVDIGKVEYPREWPNFFHDLYTIQKDTCNSLRLRLLKTVVEEFVSSREDADSSRKNELKVLMGYQVANVIAIAKDTLVEIYDHCVVNAVLLPFDGPADDAPSAAEYGIGLLSPSKGPAQLSLPSIGSSPTLAHLSVESPGSMRRNESQILHKGKITGENMIAAQTALEIILQSFSWVSLAKESDFFGPLLGIIFKFAQLNDDAEVALGTTAMSCLNELLSRAFIPTHFVEYLMIMAKQVCGLLRFLITDSSTPGGRALGDVDERYREKFTDFLVCFVAQQIGRAEATPSFPMTEFLQLLFEFTLVQPSPESFVACIGIWDGLIEHLMSSKSKDGGNSESITKYQNGLCSLTLSVHRKLQFMDNANELRDIDVDIDPGETQSDWQKFSEPCLDIIAKSCELYPDQIVLHLFTRLNQQCNCVFAGGANVQYALRDLELSLMLFSRIAHIFTGSFQQRLSHAGALIEKFLSILDICHERKSHGSLTSKTLGTLSIYVHWVSAFYNCALQEPMYQQQCHSLMQQLFTTCIKYTESSDADSVIASYKLLVSLSSTVRYSNTLQFAFVQSFLCNLHSLASVSPNTSLNSEKIRLGYTFATNVFVLLGPDAKNTDAEWNQRGSGFLQFFQSLSTLYRRELGSLSQNTGNAQSRSAMINCLTAFSSCMSAVNSEGTPAKNVVYSAIREFVPITFNLLSTFANDDDILPTLLDFTINLFESHKKQVSKENIHLIHETVQLFLQLLATQNRLTQMLSNQAGHLVLDKFVVFLTSLMQDPSKTFEVFLPDLIQLCVTDLHPRCFQDENTTSEELRIRFYNLIQVIILNHWRYFFGSSVGRMIGQAHDGIEHPTEFDGLLGILARSLGTSNVEIFKNNMSILISFNTKCNLFSKEYFQQTMLVPFVELFFEILLQRSVDFLRDDIVSCVGQMVLTNLTLFQDNFVGYFLDKYATGQLTQAQTERLRNYLVAIKDTQSWTENINQFINDFHYYSVFRQKQDAPV